MSPRGGAMAPLEGAAALAANGGRARVIDADERTAKAAIAALNRASGKTSELEEAWIVHTLVREDGLPQIEVADLLGRHKSWVCRRLALIERLGEAARAELRVGPLTPTYACGESSRLRQVSPSLTPP